MFIYGLIIGALVVLLAAWLRWRGITVKWWEYALTVVGLALFFFGWQNYSATRAEFWNPETPMTFFLVFCLPGSVLILVAAGLVAWRWWRKRKAAGPAPTR